MSFTPLRIPSAILVIWALSVTAACGPREPSEPAPDAAAVEGDPCAEGGDVFRTQVICQNQELATLEAEVQETLIAQAAGVDGGSAAQAFRMEQDRWLNAQRIACGLATPTSEPDETQAACLADRLRERAQSVRDAVQVEGPFTFRRVEDVSAEAVTASAAAASGLGDMAPMAITRAIRYPQIGGEQTPAVRRFNELVRMEPRFRIEDQTSETVNYDVVFAGEDIVSVRFDIYDEPLSAAHGNTELRAVTVNMREGRPLAAADVFRAGSGWENFLTQRAMAELTRSFDGTGFVPSEDDVRETATKPPQWLVTEDALVILFPPLSFAGPQFDGGLEVKIPWTQLRAYLAGNAPRPINQSAQ